MKYVLIPLLILLMTPNDANARKGVPYCSDCEYVEIIAELPDTEDYTTEDGETVDLGYFYKQFWLVWIPIWNSDGRYVLATGEEDEDVIYDVGEEEINAIAAANNITLSSNPISFWNKIGGKLIIGLLVVLIIYGAISGKDDEEEVVAPEESA